MSHQSRPPCVPVDNSEADEGIRQKASVMSGATSNTFRPRDRAVYGSFICYCLGCVALFGLSEGSIQAYITLGTLLPGFALLLLIAFQVSATDRCSPLAFCLVFVGILILAFVSLNIAAEAAASV